MGLRRRDEVHQLGLWHKSAHVFLFDPAGHMLIQQRAADKDLYADLWDYSVGEHLQPGEDFLSGALRGLQEELGITEVGGLEALGGMRWVEIQGAAHIDREIDGAFVASIGVGTVWADQAQPRREPDPVSAEIAQRAKQLFEPTGRFNPGRTPGA